MALQISRALTWKALVICSARYFADSEDLVVLAREAELDRLQAGLSGLQYGSPLKKRFLALKRNSHLTERSGVKPVVVQVPNPGLTR